MGDCIPENSNRLDADYFICRSKFSVALSNWREIAGTKVEIRNFNFTVLGSLSPLISHHIQPSPLYSVRR